MAVMVTVVTLTLGVGGATGSVFKVGFFPVRWRVSSSTGSMDGSASADASRPARPNRAALVVFIVFLEIQVGFLLAIRLRDLL